jgi:hypothetical protein
MLNTATIHEFVRIDQAPSLPLHKEGDISIAEVAARDEKSDLDRQISIVSPSRAGVSWQSFAPRSSSAWRQRDAI